MPRTRVSADFLATFQVNPWTALYVGYTEGLEDIDRETGDVLGLRRTADSISNRSSSIREGQLCRAVLTDQRATARCAKVRFSRRRLLGILKKS